MNGAIRGGLRGSRGEAPNGPAGVLFNGSAMMATRTLLFRADIEAARTRRAGSDGKLARLVILDGNPLTVHIRRSPILGWSRPSKKVRASSSVRRHDRATTCESKDPVRRAPRGRRTSLPEALSSRASRIRSRSSPTRSKRSLSAADGHNEKGNDGLRRRSQHGLVRRSVGEIQEPS
jgi:hypothetical protein